MAPTEQESASPSRPPLFVAQLPENHDGERTIKRVLIANRGEIACRVISTCRKLNLTSIAIYVEEDLGSRHIQGRRCVGESWERRTNHRESVSQCRTYRPDCNIRPCRCYTSWIRLSERKSELFRCCKASWPHLYWAKLRSHVDSGKQAGLERLSSKACPSCSTHSRIQWLKSGCLGSGKGSRLYRLPGNGQSLCWWGRPWHAHCS